MTNAESTSLLEETLDSVFTEHCGPGQRQRAELDGWLDGCWRALAETGLNSIGVPERAGGSGGDVHEAAALLRVAGRHAVPLPLAEGTLVGGWLVGAANLGLPPGPLTVAVPRDGDRLELDGTRVRGTLQRVPWGARSAAVVGIASAADGDHVVLLDPTRATVRHGRNVAGEPRDTLTWDGVSQTTDTIGSEPFVGRDELTLRGAMSRALLSAGAMESVARMTIEYAEQRHQFGRPIRAFQAVGQRLVQLSSETEAAALAVEVATRRLAQAGVSAAFEVWAAKTAAARAASAVTMHAHQVHGAIGMTQEFSLHHFTRRLWTWRQEWGSQRDWARTIGEHVLAAGADGLWPRIATGLVAAD